MNHNERKRKLLTFLLSSKEEQPILFRDIINDELKKQKEYYDEKLEGFNKMIYESKIDAVKYHTNILFEQMLANSNGKKYNSTLSIIERKLYIVELQLDIGIYNLLHNKNVKFYFDT